MTEGGMFNVRLRVVVAACVVLAAGCATQPESEANDPLEPTNRKFHVFNNTLDRHVLEPVADAYVEVTPDRVRESVGNFFNNITYPNTILNDFLQGKVGQGLADTSRFILNSTFGFGGLFDVAAAMGLPMHEEDFGQTLAVWGSGEGVYLELPFFGPSSGRDAPGIPVAAVTNVLFYVGEAAISIPLGALKVVDDRARLDTAIRLRDESALDTYVFTREAYRQRRRHLIYDGDPPLEDFIDVGEEEEI